MKVIGFTEHLTRQLVDHFGTFTPLPMLTVYGPPYFCLMSWKEMEPELEISLS